MSAPPGYSATASMLPAAGGTIHAMQGGGDSPYTGGVTEMNSMLPRVPPIPIPKYEGGADNNATRVAIASTVANSASAAPVVAPMVAPMVAPNAASQAAPIAVAVAAQSGAPMSASNAASNASSNAASNAVPIAVATSAAQSASDADGASVDSAVEPIAVSVAAASHLSSSNVDSPIDILNGNPTAKAAIAAVSALAISNLKDSSMFDEEEDDAEKKPIKIYGKDYNLPDPAKYIKSEKWMDVMATTGLNALSDEDQMEFKTMIYKEPTCIEEDLLIGTSIKCKAMRKLIFKVAMKLLNSPFSVPSGIELTFREDANIKHLSNKGIKRLKNVGNAAKTAEQKRAVTGEIKAKKPKNESAAEATDSTPEAAASAPKAAASAPEATDSAPKATASLQPITPKGSSKATSAATPQPASSVSASSTFTPPKLTPVAPQASSVEPPKKGGLHKRTRRTIRKK